jgi:hypothetical protein
MAEYDKAVRRVPVDLRKEAKAEVCVIELPEDRLDEAVDLLIRSFLPNPPLHRTSSPTRKPALVPYPTSRELACQRPSA